MEKLPMCRICLVEDVRMYVVVNKNLHQLYERLTDVPFVTEDSRPMLACFFCSAKLKQCWRFQRKCLEAEELFTQMMNEDYEQDPLISQGQQSFYNEFVKTPVENINIVGACQTESDDIIIKEELPDVSQNLDDITEPKEEHQTNVSELDKVDNSYADVEATSTLAESDSDDASLLEIKSVVEVELEPAGAPDTKTPKLDTRRSTGDTIPVELMKTSEIAKCNDNHPKSHKVRINQNYTNNRGVNNSINNTALSRSTRKNSSKSKISKKGIARDDNDISGYQRGDKDKCFKCYICQKSFNTEYKLTRHKTLHDFVEKRLQCDICLRSFKTKKTLKFHLRTHTEEKPFKCNICERKFSTKHGMLVHFPTHFESKRFKCYTCGGLFETKNNLKHHICNRRSHQS